MLTLLPVRALPEVRGGDDLPALLAAALGLTPPVDGDVLVVAQKIVSKAEGRCRALADVTPSAAALARAAECGKDPRLVELVLGEATAVVRCRPGVLIVRHRLGFTVANAGIDQSNVPGGDHALLLPLDPDASAARLRDGLRRAFGVDVAVVVNDSFGRPWRLGTCGTAIGCAGLRPLADLRGRPDRHGRPLQSTEVATADEIAAAASLVMGQAGEGVPAVLLRGLVLPPGETGAGALVRPAEMDLFG